MKQIILIYLIIANLYGLLLMYRDKRKAKAGAYRIPEKNLFLAAILGGSIGSIAGMYLFHHKTKHKSFTIGMPLILLLQIILGLGIKFVF